MGSRNKYRPDPYTLNAKNQVGNLRILFSSYLQFFIAQPIAKAAAVSGINAV
jgi:hypothetical protein